MTSVRSLPLICGALLSLVLLGALVPGAARAAAPPDTTLTLSAPAGYADTSAPVSVRLVDAGGVPIADAAVLLERLTGDTWSPVETLTTDANGQATTGVVRARSNADNRLRARFVGDQAHGASRDALDLTLRQRRAQLALVGPASVVDGRALRLDLTWRTATGDALIGRVRLLSRVGRTPWKLERSVRTDRAGQAGVRLRPRVDTRYRVTARGRDWLTSAHSAVLRVDNTPPGVPVVLPDAAPTPRVSVPTQARATGKGAHPVTTRIPNGVWRSMVGRSWHSGCPVGRSGLRLVRVNYWGYDGYRYRGELVAASWAADNMAGALRDMYAARLPIRSMYRVDRFGYSGRVNGGNDYRSMAAGNTSAFNCRSVVNKPGVRSPHSYGYSLDVNTWENPYRSATGLVPNSWWQSHSDPRVAWRSASHPVVRIMARHGLAWTYGLGDTQHFDVRGGSGRRVVGDACAPVACD